MALNALKARVLTEMGAKIEMPTEKVSGSAQMQQRLLQSTRRPEHAQQLNMQPAGTLDQEPDLFRATK